MGRYDFIGGSKVILHDCEPIVSNAKALAIAHKEMNNLYYFHEGETFDGTCIGELNAATR
jgi:hypothetical protein